MQVPRTTSASVIKMATVWKKNAAKAVEWYRKAAEQGEVHAQYNLGGCYENSIGGLTQNNDEALKWYKKQQTRAMRRLKRQSTGCRAAAWAVQLQPVLHLPV